jgi:hypothetical protein
MYTLVSYMYNFDNVQITVVLNVQNFGKCFVLMLALWLVLIKAT